MKINIRKAEFKDAQSIVDLIKHLAAFEKEPEAAILTKEDIERDGFGNQPLFHVFVAETDGNVVGMAFYYYRYSTWTGKTIHLEDLIIFENFRKKNIGSLLYKEVMKEAFQQKVKRVEWVVLDWNMPARDFYIRSGAKILEGWETVQMDEEGLKNFVKNC
jgi:GNAT superfamily N-acetyltransferase